MISQFSIHLITSANLDNDNNVVKPPRQQMVPVPANVYNTLVDTQHRLRMERDTWRASAEQQTVLCSTTSLQHKQLVARYSELEKDYVLEQQRYNDLEKMFALLQKQYDDLNMAHQVVLDDAKRLLIHLINIQKQEQIRLQETSVREEQQNAATTLQNMILTAEIAGYESRNSQLEAHSHQNQQRIQQLELQLAKQRQQCGTERISSKKRSRDEISPGADDNDKEYKAPMAVRTKTREMSSRRGSGGNGYI